MAGETPPRAPLRPPPGPRPPPRHPPRDPPLPTPTPAEILRTVKVALIPAPRRPMHTPSKACSRSLSPSRTRTITRTVSPGSKAGRLVFNPSRSIALSRSIPSPSILISGPQVGPPVTRQALGLRRPPRRDRSEEHTSELQSPCNLVCRLLLEKKKTNKTSHTINRRR